MPLPSTPKISIIVLNWNGKQDTIACLDSLLCVTYPYCDIILIDNGSTDGSAAAIQERFPKIHMIAVPHNLGFAGGNNIGIKFAIKQKSEFVLLLNNDTIVSPDLLEHFIQGFMLYPSAGILGARIYLFDQKETLDHLGGMWIKKKADVRLIGFREKDTSPILEPLSLIDYVCGACMMIKRDVIEKIGVLEPRYFLYWEENDFCLQAQRAGFDILTCHKARIWHKVSASIIGGRPHSKYFWWRGRLLWIARNYSSSEKVSIYLKVIFPAIFKLLKTHMLKMIQLGLLYLFRPKEDHTQRRQKLRNTRAALTGIRDYFIKRFDKGPSWIYTNPRK